MLKWQVIGEKEGSSTVTYPYMSHFIQEGKKPFPNLGTLTRAETKVESAGTFNKIIGKTAMRNHGAITIKCSKSENTY